MRIYLIQIKHISTALLFCKDVITVSNNLISKDSGIAGIIDGIRSIEMHSKTLSKISG